MADLKISQLTGATTPLAGTEVLPIVQSGSTVKVSVDNLTAGKPVSMTNLTFTGTGSRITGDFTNATASNRVLFQTSTVNSNTLVGVIPNGTATQTNFILFNSSDANNSSVFNFLINATEARINPGATGTGTALPLTLFSGGAERVKVETSGDVKVTTGNLVIGTAGKGLDFGSSVLWRTGAGSPEGVVTAAVGSLYTRTDGGLLTTLYVKESGAGNTGWVGK
jgi:hypothetical protein